MLRAGILSVLLAVARASISSPGVDAGKCVCANINVNARNGAGLSAAKVTLIAGGSCAKTVGGVVNKDGYQWFELDYNGQRVWSAGNFFDARPDSSCGAPSSSSGGGRTCHGNIQNLHPTGRSKGGVAASHGDVQHDLPYLERYRACYQQAADENCIQASVIAAIASRESRGGSLLESTGGYGDGGHGWGIMQCDIYSSGMNCKQCGWNSCCHIKMMTRDILVRNVNMVKSRMSGWTQDQALQGGVAAYNFGVSNVRSWNRLDIGTTWNDYSNDVIARAQWLYGRGWN